MTWPITVIIIDPGIGTGLSESPVALTGPMSISVETRTLKRDLLFLPELLR